MERYQVQQPSTIEYIEVNREQGVVLISKLGQLNSTYTGVPVELIDRLLNEVLAGNTINRFCRRELRNNYSRTIELVDL